MLRQCHRGGDQALQRGQRARVEFLGRQRGRQAPRVGHQPAHQPLTERIVRRGGEEVVVAEPGGNARAGHIRPVRQRLAGRRIDPFGHQGPRAQPGSIGAEGAQVAQPGEAVRGSFQHCGRRDLAPGAGPQGADATTDFQVSAQQSGAAAGIAWPWIAHGQGGSVGHAAHAQAGQARDHPARIAQPAPRIGGAHPGWLSPRKAPIAAA